MREEAAAACRFGVFHWITFWIPVIDVIIPIIPARNENITRKPVAKFPNGKYIGNILAGGVR